MLLPLSTSINKILCQFHPPSCIAQWKIIATVITVINYNVHNEKNFPPPGNTAIIIFFTKPVLIKSKYELIYSTHTLIVKSCSYYEASVCVGVFLKFTSGSQSKGSSIVALSNPSRGVT